MEKNETEPYIKESLQAEDDIAEVISKPNLEYDMPATPVNY